MVDLTQLANAFVETFQAIPDLVAELNNSAPESVFAYIDSNPKQNNLTVAIYKQPAGTVMVAWDETGVNQGAQEMGMWTHRYYFTCRADRGKSALALINLLVNGTPVPGDGMRWRYCGVMPGVLPTDIIEIVRIQDSEGVDYYAIHAEIKETGDA